MLMKLTTFFLHTFVNSTDIVESLYLTFGVQEFTAFKRFRAKVEFAFTIRSDN